MRLAAISNAALLNGNKRLDASFHASSGMKALRFIHQWAGTSEVRPPIWGQLRGGTKIPYGINRADLLPDVCIPGGIFIPTRFKRIFVDDTNHGAPYLTGGLILQAEPTQGAKLLSYRFTPNLERLFLQERMILITCSGTIGNSVYANADHVGTLGSPDLLRIISDPQRIAPGYLYAYLSSSLGRALVEQKTYGAVVPHIEAHHVMDMPVPRLDLVIETSIHTMIEKSSELRVTANKILYDVQMELLRRLGPIDTYLGHRDLIFSVGSGGLGRLTASNNRPSIRAARQVVVGSSKSASLKDVSQRIYHPFRMNMIYVAPERGVPFLNLNDMLAARYQTANYMSPLTQSYSEYLLSYGMTLISRDGTIGKVCFVGNYLAGAATNQHITRIIPDERQIPSGYLYAFMASPYSQLQVDGLVYGSVIPGVYEKDLGEIAIALMPKEVMHKIGKDVEQAFENRYLANKLEDQAQTTLAETLGLSASDRVDLRKEL